MTVSKCGKVRRPGNSMSTNALATSYSLPVQKEAGDAFVDAVCVCLWFVALPVKN